MDAKKENTSQANQILDRLEEVMDSEKNGNCISDKMETDENTSKMEKEETLNEREQETDAASPGDGQSDELTRMIQLRKALHTTTNKSIAAAKKLLFKKSLAHFFKKHPKALHGLENQFETQLQNLIHTEVDLMFQEEGMSELMNKLDQLIMESPNSEQPAWRPNGDVGDSLRPHIMAVKLKHKQKLQNILQESETENKRLQQILTKKTQVMLKTVETCKSNVNSLEQEQCDLQLDRDFKEYKNNAC